MLHCSINPQSGNFRQKLGRLDSEKFITTRLVCKFTTASVTQNVKLNPNRVKLNFKLIVSNFFQFLKILVQYKVIVLV